MQDQTLYNDFLKSTKYFFLLHHEPNINSMIDIDTDDMTIDDTLGYDDDRPTL